jgi:hypothetical protein
MLGTLDSYLVMDVAGVVGAEASEKTGLWREEQQGSEDVD